MTLAYALVTIFFWILVILTAANKARKKLVAFAVIAAGIPLASGLGFWLARQGLAECDWRATALGAFALSLAAQLAGQRITRPSYFDDLRARQSKRHDF